MADHPDDAQFAGIRGELARLFLQHKGDLGLADWSDDQVIAKTSDITAVLFGCAQVAMQRGDAAWFERRRWFGDASARLFADQSAAPLDG